MAIPIEGKNLLTSTYYVQTPIIQVKIGEYEFGVYKKDAKGGNIYPNYIQSVDITKINGQVNTYELQITYPITEYSDPNYFEKVFASVAKSRAISFSYGDASVPNYLYKNEEGIITNVKANFNLDSSNITYTVSAVSQAALGLTGSESFAAREDQPSRVIEEVLTNPYYGLQDLFKGMQNMTMVNEHNLIPHNDLKVQIDRMDNISPLGYIEYLVSLMNTSSSTSTDKNVFIMSFVDDTSGILGGSYFKVTEVDSSIDHAEAYQIDLGYPGSNYVFKFDVENDENYSIFYDYQTKLHPQEITTRINANGEMEEVYAPRISSNNANHQTTESEKSWWAKVTQYPIKASIQIKGLLRPAVLMTYVRLNIILYGQRHINSGLYIVTKQVDKIDGSGYMTTLNLLRIGSD